MASRRTRRRSRSRARAASRSSSRRRSAASSRVSPPRSRSTAAAEPVRAPAAMRRRARPRRRRCGGRLARQGARAAARAPRRRARVRQDRARYERNAKRKLLADRLDLEALQPVLAGKVPLVVAPTAEADIRAALRLAHEQKLALAIVGGAEAWRVGGGARDGEGPVLARSDRRTCRRASPRATSTTMRRRCSTRPASHVGDLDARRLVGRARRSASSPATRSATACRGTRRSPRSPTVPARLYGLTGRGTLEKGAVADVVVWSGDPLETYDRRRARDHRWRRAVARDHQTRLLERYRKLPEVSVDVSALGRLAALRSVSS